MLTAWRAFANPSARGTYMEPPGTRPMGALRAHQCRLLVVNAPRSLKLSSAKLSGGSPSKHDFVLGPFPASWELCREFGKACQSRLSIAQAFQRFQPTFWPNSLWWRAGNCLHRIGNHTNDEFAGGKLRARAARVGTAVPTQLDPRSQLH